MKFLISILLLVSSPAFAAFSVNVMAPLSVGNVRDPGNPAQEGEWQKLRFELARMKALGVTAVSTDVWWGVVEGKGPGLYDWRYYDRLSDEILSAGLQWVPILSFHQCGGNVGDTCDFPIPSWLAGKYGAGNLEYVSEDGNRSLETVSVWSTPLVLGDLSRFMRVFQEHFAPKASRISELNISLGPAGELRFPSYNSHDPGAGYPSRGRLQAYSSLARESFRSFMVKKYGTSAAGMEPPHRGRTPEAEDFFGLGMPAGTTFGRDFFDWYSDSLLEHGRLVLTEAVKVFDAPSSPFRGIDIGAKVPGVHWRASIDRSAELAAGLVRTSRGDLNSEAGHGYAPIIGLFREIGKLPGAPRVVLHFTCLEMDDGDGGAGVGSLAKSLVFWVAQEAHRQNVTIKGENALSGAIYGGHAWDNLVNASVWGGYEGLTLLRMGDVAASEEAAKRIPQILKLKNP